MKHAPLLVALLMTPNLAAAQDPLSAARDLYASAAYEDALSALARVKEGAPHLAQQVDQYRAFSLFALGRTAEAESVVEAVIRRDPLVVPDARDASPRIAAMFGQVRKRLLPELIRDGYRSARATMEKGDNAGAVPKLEQIQKMLTEARKVGASDEALDDLGVLAEGFLDLARSVVEREAEEKAAAEKAALPAPAPPPAARAEAAASLPPRIYSAADTDVVAPVAIRQQLPAIPLSLARSMSSGKTSGMLEVTINEKGRVDDLVMRDPVNSAFDAMVLAAAKSWQYKPATRNGDPVKYVKQIQVSIASPAR